MENPQDPVFQGLFDAARRGTLSRRQVLKRAAALGLSAPVVAALLAACGSSSSSSSSSASEASTSTGSTGGAGSTATTGAGAGTGTPTSEAETTSTSGASAPTKRGEGGELKLLWWQAPHIMNPHFASGDTDVDAGRVVLEPLAEFDGDGNPTIPILADHSPSLENGEVAKDGKSVTWKLKQGVKWSDGQPFTSADVKFTYELITDPESATTTFASYNLITSIDTPDDYTAVLHFKDPTPNWFAAFCGYNGMVLPQHLLKDSVGKAARTAPFNLKPIGTGAYKVDEFVPGDHAIYSINDNYRDATKPFFSKVNLKAGGDPSSAAQAVIKIGEVDYAWNLQIPANVLKSLDLPNSPGKLIIQPGTSAEQMMVNMTDPNKTVDGQKSHLGTPHPFQADPNVRKAYALMIDRGSMTKTLYGAAGQPATNILVSPQRFASKNTSWKYDIEAAGKLLDDAGWKKGSDGTREKNGVKMEVVFATTTNSLRQQEQEIIKDGFQKAGIKMTLKSIDAGVFFSGSAGNPDSYQHFYYDLIMFTNGPTNAYPIQFMRNWWGDKSNIAQRENQWAGYNIERWQNADYDKLYEQGLTELDPNKQAELFIQMNDMVVDQVVRVPLVWRSGVTGVSRTLENMDLHSWTSSDLWNLANWTRKKS